MTNTQKIIINKERKADIIEHREKIDKSSIIEFRTDKNDGTKRTKWKVPTKLLSFRKENARIEAEVRTHELSIGPIQEDTKEGQELLGKFLAKSDTKNMDLLKTLLEAHGQEEPAVATADGRLLNGNRRLRALRELYEEQKKEEFAYMQVVILPSGNPADDYGEGAKPTIKEIQALEYNYQVRQSGRSEYTGLNLALMYRSNIENRGITLEELMKQDPNYMNMPVRQFNTAVRKVKQESLDTLIQFDEYLKLFDRGKMYSENTESGSIAGERWQAFIDWTKSYRQISDDNNHRKFGITPNDIGNIKRAAFKIIRQQDLHKVAKPHEFMRKIPRILENKQTKKLFYRLADEKNIPSVAQDEKKKKDDNRTFTDIDKKWSKDNGSKIVNIVKKITHELTYDDSISKPVKLLEQALEKLNHSSMSSEVYKRDNEKCLELCNEILDRADDLYTLFDKNRMKLDALASLGK